MRILEAIYSNTLGGSETLALRLARAFCQRGHSSDILLTFAGDGTFDQSLSKSGLTVFASNFDGRSVWKRIHTPIYLYRLFRSRRYDVVHCHHMPVFIRCINAAKAATTPKIVVTEHAHQHFAKSPKLMRRTRRTIGKADAVTVIHRQLSEFFAREIGVPDKKLHLIENTIDTNLFSPLCGAPSKKPDQYLFDHKFDYVIGCVSRLHVDKDIPNLIRAFKIVVDQSHLEIGLVVVGEGQERARIESLTNELQLGDSVQLVGVQDDIVNWLNTFDAFVLPSRREGVPLSLMEAMSCGLPVVATDVGGVSEVLDSESGLLVPREDPDQLAASMLTLLQDPDLGNRLGRNARGRIVEKYGFDSMVDKYLDVFRE